MGPGTSTAARTPAILLIARELDTDRAAASFLNAALMRKPVSKCSLAAAIGGALEPAGT